MLIDRDSEVTIMRQCELLGVCRSSLYCRPKPVWQADLRLMRRIDELHLKHPFLGARRLARMLQREGFDVGRRYVGKGVRVSMDGKGRWVDNVLVERPWRSVKYEDIYLHAYETMRELKAALANYFDFYNTRRPHQNLDYRTPDDMHFGINEMKKAA
jgi:Integrase core domain